MTPDQRTALREALDPHPLTATMVQNVELVSLLDAADRADRLEALLRRMRLQCCGWMSRCTVCEDTDAELGATR